MSLKLFFEAVIKFLLGVILVGALIFLSAGSFAFFSGWLFMGVLFVPMFLAGIVMLITNPELLRARLDAKEKQSEQGRLVKFSGLMFVLGFVIAGLDFRFYLTNMPMGMSIAFAVVFLVGYILYAEVLRENTYLSRTIKVEVGQKVIDTGLYGIVRHPMYSVTLILFLSMPIILGSIFSFLIFLSYPFIIAERIKHEEKLLEAELEGYAEYKKKVKWRLIPYIW